MLKSVYIILLFCSIINNGYSQDSSSYKNKIDSILISRSKLPVNKKKIKVDNFRIRYFIKKKTKELYLIEATEQKGKELLIYNYHYIDGELTMISKYHIRPVKDKMKETAFYYLKKGSLVYRVENNTQIMDLNYHQQNAQQLKSSAPY